MNEHELTQAAWHFLNTAIIWRNYPDVKKAHIRYYHSIKRQRAALLGIEYHVPEPVYIERNENYCHSCRTQFADIGDHMVYVPPGVGLWEIGDGEWVCPEEAPIEF